MALAFSACEKVPVSEEPQENSFAFEFLRRIDAAAVSSSGVFVTDAGQSSLVLFRADHPFIYVISEAGTGAVLFAGRFVNQ